MFQQSVIIVTYFAPDDRQMCSALDLCWFTHTLSAGSWPVLQAVSMIAILYIRVSVIESSALIALVLCSCNTESDWSQIHENIIKKVNSRYNLSGSNTGNETFKSFINNSFHKRGGNCPGCHIITLT